jgi:hypothetical protein
MHAKMDFSQQKLEQKWPVFLLCTQCNDSNDTAHTWQDGEGFCGDEQALEGGIMVTRGCDGDPRDPRRIHVQSEWYWLGQTALWPSEYHSDSTWESCTLDNFESNEIENMSGWQQNKCESRIWNLWHGKLVVRLEDELTVVTMGSKDHYLSNFTLF